MKIDLNENLMEVKEEKQEVVQETEKKLSKEEINEMLTLKVGDKSYRLKFLNYQVDKVESILDKSLYDYTTEVMDAMDNNQNPKVPVRKALLTIAWGALSTNYAKDFPTIQAVSNLFDEYKSIVGATAISDFYVKSILSYMEYAGFFK